MYLFCVRSTIFFVSFLFIVKFENLKQNTFSLYISVFVLLYRDAFHFVQDYVFNVYAILNGANALGMCKPFKSQYTLLGVL